MKTKNTVIALLIALSTSANSLVFAEANEAYIAHLTPINAEKIGAQTTGEATFEVVGDTLKIHIKVQGAPPNIEHWEHFHGFADGKDATCATISQDTNKDGYIDLDETASVSGTTMVPFNAEPAKMDIPTNTYPRASADGSYEYIKLVPLKELEKTFGKIYPGQSIDLDKRVVYIHGIPSAETLPKSVGSLGSVPAQVTLPIACGKIEKVKKD